MRETERPWAERYITCFDKGTGIQADKSRRAVHEENEPVKTLGQRAEKMSIQSRLKADKTITGTRPKSTHRQEN